MIEKIFTYRDRWGQGITLWIVVAMCFAAPFILMGLSKVRLENDVTSWLPADDPDAQVLHWFHENFEHESRLIISWEGSSLTDPRLTRFAEALQAKGEFAEQFRDSHPEQMIETVSTPLQGLDAMVKNDIPQDEALQRLVGVLIGPGHLKIRWTPEARQHIAQSEQELQSAVTRAGLGLQLQFLPPDPPRALPIIAETQAEPTDAVADEADTTVLDWASLSTLPEHDIQIRAEGMAFGSEAAIKVQEVAQGLPSIEDCFYVPGSPVALSVSLTKDGEDLLQPLFDHIHKAAVAAGIPESDLHLGGGPVSRYRLNREGARAIWNTEYPAWMVHKRSPIILSTLATVILAFLLLRSFRLSTLVLLASMYITMAVVALIPATGKSLNLVLIVLPNLLMVLTTSGAVHLANYWKHEALIAPEKAIARAVQQAFIPCVLASITTAVGMASLLTSVLGPVRDFGIYSSIGCILSLGMILFGFPAMMSVWPGSVKKPHADDDCPDSWQHLGEWLVRHSTAVVTVCMVVFAVSLYGLRWFQTETKVIRYFPPQTRLYQDYQYLEESLAGIVSVEVLVKFPKAEEIDPTADPVDDAAEPVKKLNVLDRMELVRRLETELARHPGVSGTISLADFRPVSPDPSESLSRYALTVRRTEKGLFEEHAKETKALVQRVTAPLQVDNGQHAVNFVAGDEVWRIRCQTAVLNDINYGELVRDLEAIAVKETSSQQGVDYVITGMVPLFLRTQEAVLDSLIESFALAFVLIAIIMVFLLKHPVSGLLAMIPNLFPVGVVFGLVAWGDIPVDIGTMITASVALGIAIDGTLHLLTWFQAGLRSGLSRNEAVIKSLKHCGPAMWQTSVAIAVGMFLLIGADLLLISRFGWLMAALVMVALLGDIILLPALLTGWLGAIIERTVVKDGSDAEPATHAPPASTDAADVLTFPVPEQRTESQLRRAPGM